MKIKKNARTIFVLPSRVITNSLAIKIIHHKLKKERIFFTKKQPHKISIDDIPISMLLFYHKIREM